MKTNIINQQLQGDGNAEIECECSSVSFMKVAMKKLHVHCMNRNYKRWNNSVLSQHTQQTEPRKRMKIYLQQLNGLGNALQVSYPIRLVSTPGWKAIHLWTNSWTLSRLLSAEPLWVESSDGSQFLRTRSHLLFICSDRNKARSST